MPLPAEVSCSPLPDSVPVASPAVPPEARVRVTVSTAPASGSATVAWASGLTTALSAPGTPDVTPPSVGASYAAVALTSVLAVTGP